MAKKKCKTPILAIDLDTEELARHLALEMAERLGREISIYDEAGQLIIMVTKPTLQ